MKTLVKKLINNGRLKTTEIIRAFEKIDRADFVSERYLREERFMDAEKDLAYVDNAFPIGHGQTISQPMTVAIMFELLQPKEGDKVLDIGFGSGWTTALLAKIAGPKGKIYAIEIIPELYQFGKENVKKYGFKNVEFFNQDGSKGLAKYAPYDKILASAAVPQIPPPLKKQLKIGGVLVLPVGGSILKIIKKTSHKFDIEEYPFFAFVPMRGKYGQ